jgi:hypothetical protein
MDRTNSASAERTMSAHREGRRPVHGQIRPSGRMVRKVLLALGIVGPLFYVAIDILLATRWEGYSYTDQTVSELFAIGGSDETTRRSAYAHVWRACDRIRVGRLGIGW